MPAILGANSVSGYEISNSLRFNDNDSAYLGRTPGSAGTSVQTWTFSCWAKRSTLSGSQVIFGASNGDTSQFVDITINGNNVFELDILDSNSTRTIRTTAAAFRDPSAWYHFVIVVDTTQSTDSNRLKLYVNGDEIATVAGTGTFPAQNANTQVNATTGVHAIGRRQGSTDRYYDGYLTEINHVDGQALTPTSFGEEDDNGVWVPKKYSGTYGTNGFFLEFKQTGTSQNSSGIGADTSGNDNHLSVTNLAAIDVTTDTPTNNFATLNPLAPGGSVSYSDAALVANAGANAQRTVIGTIAVSSGKWYWETMWTEVGGNDASAVGIQDVDNLNVDGNIAGQTNAFAYLQDGRKQNDSAVSSYGTRFENGDIVGTALNLDDGTITFYLNGSSQGVAFTSLPSLTYFLAAGFYNNNTKLDVNFGNPQFAISSGNNDGKYGNFEYAPPAGYYAVCTKRLAQFG